VFFLASEGTHQGYFALLTVLTMLTMISVMTRRLSCSKVTTGCFSKRRQEEKGEA